MYSYSRLLLLLLFSFSLSLCQSFVSQVLLQPTKYLGYPHHHDLLTRQRLESKLSIGDPIPNTEIKQDIPTAAIVIVTVAVCCSVFFVFPLAACATNNDAAMLDVKDIDPRYFLAGGLCAAFSHGVTTPIDVVKTRIQVDSSSSSQDYTLSEAALMLVQEEGVGALMSGFGPTVLGYGIEGAAKFGLYESLKPQMMRILDFDSPTVPYLLASVIAGAAASVILCPMERARIRLVVEPDFAPNFISSIPKLLDEIGIQGLFYGFPAMLSKQIPYTAGKQISFEVACTALYKVVNAVGWSETDMKFEISVVAAALASIVACLLSHPGDVILTKSYQGSGDNNTSSINSSFWKVVSSIEEKAGKQGFLSGITARFLHVGVIITSQLVLYDTIKQALGLPATGSS